MRIRLGSGDRTPELLVGMSGGKEGKVGERKRAGSAEAGGAVRILDSIEGILILDNS